MAAAIFLGLAGYVGHAAWLLASFWGWVWTFVCAFIALVLAMSAAGESAGMRQGVRRSSKAAAEKRAAATGATVGASTAPRATTRVWPSDPVGSEYYFCWVGPMGEGQPYRAPGVDYRLDLTALPLQRPVTESRMHPQAVITGDELRVLSERGFKIEVRAGPFQTEAEAEDALDDEWEWPHRIHDDD